MATKVFMPQLGLTMTQGTVTKWLKNEGEEVKKGEPLLEVMTDKVNMEVEAPDSGVLLKVLAGEGQVVPIGETIGFLGELGEDLTPLLGGPMEVPVEDLPALGPGEADAVPVTKEGGKVFISPRARKAARERGVDYSRVTGSGPKGRIIERDIIAFAGREAGTPLRMSPLAQKLAESYGISPAEITGTGAKGRVFKDDVLALQAQRTAPKNGTAQVPAVAAPAGVTPLSGMRKTIAERMAYNVHTAAQVTLTTEVDMTEVVKMREQLLPEIENTTGQRISYTDILVRVVAKALREFPGLNAALREDNIELLPEVNIGVAVAVEGGLVVPVVRQADTLPLTGICARTKALIEKARQGRLLPEDLQGGTFTITNLGMYEIDAFTPIINLPETAILGVGRLVEKPVIYQGQIQVRWMMYLSLTFDHRVVDGAPAAEFLRRVKRLLENPFILIV